MARFANLTMLITCALAIYVGSRTLAIWWRTRQIQEFAIGSNVLSIALGAMLLTSLGVLGSSTGMNVDILPHAVGLFLMCIHVAALYVGTWKIFRPSDRWPIALVAMALSLCTAWMWAILTDSGAPLIRPLLYQGVRAVGMAWAGWECLRYSAMLRRQVRLGLAEPMIAHRIGLWGLGALASLLVILLDLGSLVGSGTSLVASPGGLYLTAFIGLFAAGTIALAFFPPASYVRFVAGPAGESAS